MGELLVNGQLPFTVLKDSAWYQDITSNPAHPRSREIITSQPPVVPELGRRCHNDWGMDFGMPYSVISGHPPVQVVSAYAAESDKGPFPIPQGAPIETGPDRHLICYDRGTDTTYELFSASWAGAILDCQSAAVWHGSKSDDQRPLGWTSADAAGLMILPGLVKYDEMKLALSRSDPASQHLGHALRFTLPNTGHGFLWPARHYASLVPYGLPGRPPMGMRIRLKASYDISKYNQPTQVLLRTLQKYGAILADNGAAFFFSGTADVRWAEYFDAITGVVDGKLGFKSLAKADFDDNMEVIDFADAEVVTQV